MSSPPPRQQGSTPSRSASNVSQATQSSVGEASEVLPSGQSRKKKSDLLTQAGEIKLQNFQNPEVLALTNALSHDPEALAFALLEWQGANVTEASVQEQDQEEDDAREEPTLYRELPSTRRLGSPYGADASQQFIADSASGGIQITTPARGGALPTAGVNAASPSSRGRVIQSPQVRPSSFATSLVETPPRTHVPPPPHTFHNDPALVPTSKNHVTAGCADTTRLGISIVRRSTIKSPTRTNRNPGGGEIQAAAPPQRPTTLTPTVAGSAQSVTGSSVPTLQYDQLNALQKEMLSLTIKGKNVLMTSGRHSGRCTCAALLCDRLIDLTTPPSLSMPIVILCGVHQERRLTSLLAEPISTNRVYLMTDLQYRQRPLDVVRAPDSARGFRVDREDGAALTPLFIIVGNAEHFDAFCAADALSRFEDRPQVVALLDQPFPSLEEALQGVSKGFAYASWVFLRLGMRTTLRDVVVQLEGSGHLIVPAKEEEKYNSLVDLTTQLFDYQNFLALVSSKRKAEKLAAVFCRYMDCTVAHHRSPKSISESQEDFLAARRFNTKLTQELPYGTRTSLVQKRHCIIADPGAVPLLDGLVTTHVQVVVYYDMPDSPITQLKAWSENYFTPKFSSPAGAADGGFSSSLANLQVVFADGDEEYRQLKHKTGLRWVAVDV